MHKIRPYLTITDQDIDDILVTAFEGGISYWAIDATPKDNDYKGGNYASDVISRNGVVVITDDEDETHELTLKMFLKGLSLAVADGFDLENYDAGDADNVVQYALFGELVYG